MFIYAYLVFLVVLPDTANGKIPLYIAGVLELSDLPHYFKFAVIVPEVISRTFREITLSQLGILEDYELTLDYRNMAYSAGLATKMMMELLTEDPPKVAVFGPSRSDTVAVTGQIVPFFNVIEVSYLETTPVMDDHELYPTVFNLHPNTQALNHLRINMMKYFGWTRVGTIAMENKIFQDQITMFHDELISHNMTLLSTAIVTGKRNQVKEILERFKEYDVRIIMIAAASSQVREFFCEAYHQNMYGFGYVWILSGPTLYGGAVVLDSAEMGCTFDQLVTASWGHFIVDFYTVSRENTVTLGGKLPSDIVKDLQQLAANNNVPFRDGLELAVDALWALALGLNHSIKYLDEAGLKLHEYNYSDTYLDAVLRGMREVNFNGVSGPVAFDSKGKRVGLSYLQKSYNNTIVDIAAYDSRNDKLNFLIDTSTLWPGGKAPMDKFIRMSKLLGPSITAVAIIVTMDILGTTLTLGFLFFNVYYRNNRSVKMSSPMLNNVILSGCMLMYLEVLTAAIDYGQFINVHTHSVFCMLRAWLLALAFTALFGALFSKTYRVYVIFRNSKLSRKHIRDAHLFGLIVILLVVDLIILVPWSIVHPMTKKELTFQRKTLVERNAIVSEIYHFCYNPSQGYWIASVYVYKGLLLAFGTFLAWETRHVAIPALNDSKYIGACIYNVVVVCLFGFPLAHVLPTQQVTLIFVLESLLIIFCTTVCQCIIFLPKLHLRNQVQSRFMTAQMSTWTNRTENNVTSDGDPAHSDDKHSNVAIVSADTSNDVDEVKAENRKLRMQIAQESIAIAKLRRGLLQMTGNVHFYRDGSQFVLFKTDPSNTSGVKQRPKIQTKT